MNKDPTVYFGRRNKKSPVSERAERASLDDAQFAPVASDERAALLAVEPEDHPSEDHDMTPPPPATAESPAIETDPTQPLLTALGRFHREVTRAKDDPAEGWADACMQNLITAVDIAVEHEWSDMVGTLTETARVLQTYDEANKATDAISFLDESYEILCLMVGNILVGVTRSDAGDRWDACQRKALEDLTSAGLTLVSDSNETAEEPVAVETQEEDTDEVQEPEVAEDTSEEVVTDDEPIEADFEEVEEDIVEEAPKDETTDEGAAQALDSFCAALGGLESGDEEAEEMFGAMNDGLNFLEQHGESMGYTASVGATKTMKRLCTQAEATGAPYDERFVEMAYAFCEAYMDGQSESADTTSSWTLEAESMLMTTDSEHAPAEGEAPTEEIAPEEPETPPMEEAQEEEFAEEIEDLETDDAEEDTPSIVLTDDESVAEEAAEDLSEIAPLAAPEEVEASTETDTSEEASAADIQVLEEEDDDSAMRLLAIAQRAASQGNIAEAKLLALRAATRIADDEASKSATDLIDAERRLNEGAEAVANAKNTVQESEAAVHESEAAVVEAQSTLDNVLAESARIGDVIEGLENGIAALEAQIAELLQQKENEETKLAQEREQLADADQRTTESQAALEERRAEEEEARRTLEDARQLVKHNQERRTDVEREREEIQQRLVQQRGNVSELEQTIRRTEGKSAGDEGESPEENLLFDDM